MARLIPQVDVEPPSVDPGGFSVTGMVDAFFGFVAAHPLPVVLIILAMLLAKWLTKPFVKGLMIGALILAIVFFAIGA